MFALPLQFCGLASPRFTGTGFVVVVTCVLLMYLCPTALSDETVRVEPSEDGEASIKILNLLTTKEERMQSIVDALWSGVNAALHNISYTGANNRRIEFIKISRGASENLLDIIKDKLEKESDILAILGPFSNNDTADVLESDFIRENNLVCLSPFSSSMKLRRWTRNAFFMRADPRAEIILLSKYIGQVLLVRRVGIMYLTGRGYGELESELAAKILVYNDPEVSIITYAEPSSSEFNRTSFREFAKQRPQAILVFGESSSHTHEFVEQCLTSTETNGAVLLSTSMQRVVITKVYWTLVKEKEIDPKDNQVIIGGVNAQVTDRNYHHVEVFREQMTLYNKTNNYSMDFSDSNWEEFEHRSTDAEFMLSGWIAGSMMARAFSYEPWVKDRKSLQKNLFDQNRFIIHKDFVLGDYGDTCTQFAKDQGAICECNQGGHTVYLKQYFANDTVWYVEGYNYTFPDADCYPNENESAHCVAVVVMYMQDVQYLLRAAKTLVNVAQLARKYSFSHFKLPFAASINHIDVSTSKLAEEVRNYTTDYHTSIFSGPTTTDMPKGIPMINPFFRRPRLNNFSSDTTVELAPTLEQQFFVLMMYLSDGSARHKVSSTKLTAVVRGLTPEESRAILDVVGKTAVTLGHTVVEKLSMTDDDALTSGIAVDGYTLLVGLDEDDVQRLADRLRENPNACVVLSYRDFALHYNEIVTVFGKETAAVRARLLTTTNLPLWTDYSSEAHSNSIILAQFHKVISDKAYHTPLGLESFISCSLLIQLMSLTNNDDKLLKRLYTEETIVLNGDMRFGPFREVCGNTLSGDLVDCAVVKNYGARDIYVLSMERVLDVSVPNDYPPTTPEISYNVPTRRGGLSSEAIVAIVVGCGAGFTLLLCLLWFLCVRGRDNRHAPKDARRPVTLVFTDIESSTALWAMLPQLMPCAVAMHHKLIRGVIARHKCYEVKTVGDSFMIACKEAHTATQVACEIQELMHRNRWGTCELDRAYREFEMRRRDEDVEYKPPTAMLTSDEYEALWNGLRVRIGIHTGLCDIRHDRVTGGIDYYGEVPNMTARTEAIGNGGQVLVTEWAWWSLSQRERASLQCVSLGPQRLRGVPYAVEIYQLNSVPGRRYAGLRTDLDVLLPDDDKGDTTSNDASALLSSAGTVAGPAAAMAAVLTNCFSPFSVVQRVKGLQPLLQKWNIAMPQRSTRVTDEDYCQGMINRLAIKMSSVAQMRQRLANGNGDIDVSAQLHAAGRYSSGTSSSGMVASSMVKQRSSALTADGTKVNPLNPHSHPQLQSQQQLKHVSWTHNDGDGVAFEADAIADEPSQCGSINSQGDASRVCRMASDSVVSIHIQMPLASLEKTGG